MRVETFAMERMQSTYENHVDFNLSESGVRPMLLSELLEDDVARDALLRESLRYTQTNGSEALRSLVARQYKGATPDHVEITNGGAEANYLVLWNLIDPGDDVVLMTPNYMQAPGLVRAFGGRVVPWPLLAPDGADRWAVDVDALERIVTRRTKVIAICNPNNPTGARFGDAALDRIATIAERHGAWILSDEIYRGAERDGRETPTMWGRSDRVVVTSGLSKAFGLPGLRIGWAVAPPPFVTSLWAYHDYTTIAPGALNDALAQRALEPNRREKILARTRAILNANFPIIDEFLREGGEQFQYAPPDAGAIVYVRYSHAIGSTALTTRLRNEKSVLIVPGDHFGMDRYFRVGFGDDAQCLRSGLERLGDLLQCVSI